jgi:hypothetical protein
VADEQEDKPDGEAPAEDTTSSSQETAVGHQVVEAESVPAAAAPADPAAAEAAPVEPQPAAAPPPPAGGTSPAAADRRAAEDEDPFSAKPELFIGGAFVGAFVFAKLLKKLTGGGD